VRICALAPKQREQDDDRQRDAEQPQQQASTEAHDFPPMRCRLFNVSAQTRFLFGDRVGIKALTIRTASRACCVVRVNVSLRLRD
jgi:hypothetical protein